MHINILKTELEKKDVGLLLNHIVTKSDKIKVKMKSHNLQGQNAMTSLGGPYQKRFF